MSVLPILQYPNPTLRKVSREVEPSTRLDTLLADMADTLRASRGIGLAAVQVGTLWRVVIVQVPFVADDYLELVNPKILKREGETLEYAEGCLSVARGMTTSPVARARMVVVQAMDRRGATFHLKAYGLTAVLLQHEMDHMDGILFIDRLSEEQRKAALSGKQPTP